MQQRILGRNQVLDLFFYQSLLFLFVVAFSPYIRSAPQTYREERMITLRP